MGSFPPPKRSASASSPRGAAWPKELEQLAENAASLERERSDGAGRLRELAQREREIRAAIARLEEQVRQSQEENQRLTGSRQEQMAHCDEISQTIQEIRMGELSAQKDRDTLLAAVAGLEERKRDSAGAVERLRGEIAAYGEKLAQLERDRQAALARSRQLKDQAQAQRQSLEGISQSAPSWSRRP